MIHNILSYFIKDIKDNQELAFYKKINTEDSIKIFYKDKLLYSIVIDILYFILKPELKPKVKPELNSKLIYNLVYNIKKDYYNNILYNYKIESNTKEKYVYLYYKKR